MPDAYGIVTVGAPPRGGAEVVTGSHNLKAMQLSYAWGVLPGAAQLEYPGATALAVGAALTLALGDYVFYGIVEESNVRTAPEGQMVTVRFVDSRTFLWWDAVFGVFNQPEWRVVDGLRRRMFWHVYPADAERHRRTWTNAPHTGAEILNLLFGAPTVETAWGRTYHADLATVRPLNINAVNGRPLGDVVAEVSRKCGVDVTLGGGRYALYWGRPGEGSPPAVPVQCKRASIGAGLTGNPNRVTIVGDRNRYQVLNLELEPDWAAGWQYFFDEDLFKDFVYRWLVNPADGVAFTTDDPEQLNRWAAAAYAARLTVKQFVELATAAGALADEFSLGAADFTDHRFYAGRSRMEMPALMYIRQVLYRCFRPKPFTLVNAAGQTMGVNDLRIVPDNLVAVTHDVTTGLMTPDAASPIESEGVAVAQGYQLFQDGFQSVRPDQVRLADWTGTDQLWQRLRFHVDDSGEDLGFVIFDTPVILMAGLLTEIDGQVVLRALSNVSARPAVRAALTFEGERFSLRQGTGWRDAVEYIGGLHAEFVVAGGTRTELAFGDGETATTKAAAQAAALLSRPYAVVSGGWDYPGSTGQSLSGQVDRVLVRLDASQGLVETVDYTLGRRGDAFVPEPDLTRLRQLETLFPGSDELRRQADQFDRLARVLRDNSNVRQSFYKVLYESFGYSAPGQVWIKAHATPPETLPAGTPLWGEPDKPMAVRPADAAAAHTVLKGITIRDGEPGGVADVGGVVACAQRGRCMARVRGPVAAGDSLARSDGEDYLAKSTGASGQTLAGVRVLADIEAEDTKLVPVEFGGGGGGGADGPVWL